MTKTKAEAVEMWVMRARLHYPNLFTATAYKPDRKPTYSCTLSLENDDPQLKQLKDMIINLLKEEWGENAQKVWKKMKLGNKAVLHSGDEKDEVPGFDDTVMYFACTARENDRPSVAQRNRKPAYEKDGLFYPGCYVNVKIRLYTYSNEAKGVGVGLKAVQFVEDGEQLGGSKPVTEDEFPDMGDEAEPGSAWDENDPGVGTETDDDFI